MATYPVFLSHSWIEQDGVERITSLMEAYRLKTEGFAYEYYSVSKDDPAQFLPSNKALSLSIEKQMEPCCCLVILAGVFEEFKRWTNLELDAAKKLGLPSEAYLAQGKTCSRRNREMGCHATGRRHRQTRTPRKSSETDCLTARMPYRSPEKETSHT